jgi:hypothetical protein
MFALASIASASRDRYLSYAATLLEYTNKNTRITQALEELMGTHFKNIFIEGYLEQGIETGRAEGRAEEAASALCTVLAARGIAVLDQARALINACTDPDQLKRWTARAATASTIDEVLV